MAMRVSCAVLMALSAAVVMAALAACSGEPSPSAVASGDATSETAKSCPVTQASENIAAGNQSFNYGNDALYVSLWWDGTLIAGPLPGGGSYATINRDGSIEAKLGWWRGVAGQLSIEGERLDADAPPLRAEIPDGYGESGFQATGLVFPSTGCWRVIGKIADSRLSFVVRVVTSDEH